MEDIFNQIAPPVVAQQMLVGRRLTAFSMTGDKWTLVFDDEIKLQIVVMDVSLVGVVSKEEQDKRLDQEAIEGHAEELMGELE